MLTGVRTSDLTAGSQSLLHRSQPHLLVTNSCLALATDKMEGSEDAATCGGAGEQQSARKSPDRRESTTGILRLDISKPRRSSGSSVEFRNPPDRAAPSDLNVTAS
jgi:hypothetical protein